HDRKRSGRCGELFGLRACDVAILSERLQTELHSLELRILKRERGVSCSGAAAFSRIRFCIRFWWGARIVVIEYLCTGCRVAARLKSERDHYRAKVTHQTPPSDVHEKSSARPPTGSKTLALRVIGHAKYFFTTATRGDSQRIGAGITSPREGCGETNMLK